MQESRAAMDAMRALSREAATAATEAGLAQGLVELLRIRVSQLNGCAYCLRMHTRDALAAGESPDRIALLPAWRETGYFTDIEREAIALAEHTTLLAGDPHGRPEPRFLDTAQVAGVRWVATVMNAWNRIAVTGQYDVSP